MCDIQTSHETGLCKTVTLQTLNVEHREIKRLAQGPNPGLFLFSMSCTLSTNRRNQECLMWGRYSLEVDTVIMFAWLMGSAQHPNL